MAGPGGGPPRKSHTKSRKGCKTCKSRHIRCDESFPQCRNCTKHSVRCDYRDIPANRYPGVQAPDGVDLLWTHDVEREIYEWQRTGVFPFPGMQFFPQSSAYKLSSVDLRLIHHIASVSQEMQRCNYSKFTIWTERIPTFLSIANFYDFVLHALLALSATHLAWVTDNAATSSLADHHRAEATQGLRHALEEFSSSNSDAVLAASILLSWQATTWQSWSALMDGTSGVIDAMQLWRSKSLFSDFMDEQATFPRPHASPSMMSSSHSRSPRREDIATVDHIEKSLMKVEGYLVSKNEEIRGLRELIKFIQNLRRRLPVHTAAEQFELLQPLRQWLFWLPVCYFQRAKGSSTVLIVLAHFYAVALAVEPLFPAVGAAYFGSLSISPIEKIRQALSLSQSARSAGGHVLDYGTTPLSLMDFPLQKVAEFRQRLGWARQQLQQQHQQQQTQQQQQQSAAYAYDSLLNATNPLTLSSQASTYSSPSYSSGASDSSSMIISPESISFAGRPRFLESPGQHSGGHLYSTTTATTSPFPYSPLSNSPAFSVADQSAVDYATLDYATAAVTAQGAYAPSASVWT